MYRVLWGELRRYIGMFLGAGHSYRGIVIWLGFGTRTPRGFSLGSFLFRGPGFSALLSFLLLLLLFSGGRLGCLFPPCACCGARTPDFRYLARPELHTPALVLSVSSFCPGRSPPFSSSLCLPSLSLSLFSLFCALRASVEMPQCPDHSEPG